MDLSVHLVQLMLCHVLQVSFAKTLTTKSFRVSVRKVSIALWELVYQNSAVRQTCVQRAQHLQLPVVKPPKTVFQVSICSLTSAKSASQALSAINGQTKSTLFSTKLKAALNVQQASIAQVAQQPKLPFHVQLVRSDLRRAPKRDQTAHLAETVVLQTLLALLNA